MILFCFLNALKKVEFHGALLGGYAYTTKSETKHNFTVGTDLGVRINISDHFFITPSLNFYYTPVSRMFKIAHHIHEERAADRFAPPPPRSHGGAAAGAVDFSQLERAAQAQARAEHLFNGVNVVRTLLRAINAYRANDLAAFEAAYHELKAPFRGAPVNHIFVGDINIGQMNAALDAAHRDLEARGAAPAAPDAGREEEPRRAMRVEYERKQLTMHMTPVQLLLKVGGGTRSFSGYGIVGGGAALGFINGSMEINGSATGGAGIEYRYKKFGVFAEGTGSALFTSDHIIWQIRGIAGVSVFL